MIDSNHLNLKIVRLKPSEEWQNQGMALSFVFPKSGVGKCLTGSKTSRFVEGDVLVFDSAGESKLYLGSGNELVFVHFSVTLESLFPLFASNEICFLQGISEQLREPIIHSSSKTLSKECHRLLKDVPPQFNLDHRSQLLRVVGTILNEEFNNLRGKRNGYSSPEDHLVQVFDKLSITELLTLSVGELAEKCGCSRRHLGRLFHQYFGFSVASLRMEMRLLKAVSLLRDPGAKIIHVAEQSGFNHLGLFNTCFKKRFGTSPGQWRKLSHVDNQGSNEDGLEITTCPLRNNGLCPGGAMMATAKNGVSSKSNGTPNKSSNGFSKLNHVASMFSKQGKGRDSSAPQI